MCEKVALLLLIAAQFLSAFVDNMILFVAQAILWRDAYPTWYLQLVQATFLLSYILLSPWAGVLADRYAKRNILMAGNALKSIGVVAMLAGFDPAISYAIVGIGAVVYSPAKYGILPLLTRTDSQLLKANSQVEGFTILAILLGAAFGGWLADYSVPLALGSCLGLYLVSALLCCRIPANLADHSLAFSGAIQRFGHDLMVVLADRKGKFSLLGTSGFWMASAVLRLSVFAWLPLAFGIHDNTTIGLMVTLSGVGLIAGAIVTPRLVPPANYSRIILVGALMAIGLVILPWSPSLSLALVIQTITGSFGGMYVIPLNAMLQRVGERTVGTGKAVAIQNFAENSLMFVGVSLFLLSSWYGIPVAWSMTGNGALLMIVICGLRYFCNDHLTE